MPRIFITGSADGLGRAAAGVLIGDGHDVVLHARSRERAAALRDLAAAAAGVVIGDLSSAAETRDLTGQVNQIGRMDASSERACMAALRAASHKHAGEPMRQTRTPRPGPVTGTRSSAIQGDGQGWPEPAQARLSADDRFCGALVARITRIR